MKNLSDILSNQIDYGERRSDQAFSDTYYSLLYNLAKSVTVDGVILEIGTDQCESAVSMAYGVLDAKTEKSLIISQS